MSSIFNFNFIYLSTHYIFTAAAALPPPLELFAPAVFEVGDLVQSIPDTTPGVHPRHSVAIVGAVTDLKLEGGWIYNISSMHHSQNTLWVPEHRVRPLVTPSFRLPVCQ